MKNIMTMFLGNIPNRETSYNSTQAHILKSMLEETGLDIEVPYSKTIPEDVDKIFLYHGFGFNPEKPSLNIFGGLEANDFLREHLIWLSNHKGDIVSLECEFPDLLTGICGRIDKLSPEEKVKWDDFNVDNLRSKINENRHRIYANKQRTNIVIGDSHAYSLYRPGYAVNSVPHKTLHGALNQGLDMFIPGDFNSGGKIDIMFGNIDVRHHLARQSNIGSAIKSLVSRLYDGMVKLSQHYDLEQVSFYELLPIENESRNLSKSGWYKGEPFYGNWELRNQIREAFNSEINKLIMGSSHPGLSFVKWTDCYLNDDKELDFEYMEKPRGVHLSGKHFPYWSRTEKTDEQKQEQTKETTYKIIFD